MPRKILSAIRRLAPGPEEKEEKREKKMERMVKLADVLAIINAGMFDLSSSYDNIALQEAIRSLPLEEAPTIDAEIVVRCQDCKYHSYWCEEFETRVPLDGYCWMGEKEEEDAEPVVRCKNCKWGDVTDYGAGEVLECILDRLYRINSTSLEGETYFRKVEPDNFCSWGERREDE